MADITHLFPPGHAKAAGPMENLGRSVRAAGLPAVAIGFQAKPFAVLLVPPELFGWTRGPASNDDPPGPECA